MGALLFFLVVSFTLSSALEVSTPLNSSLLSAQPASVSYCDRDYSCADCSTVRVCAPTTDRQHLYEVARFTCTTSNPYCNFSTGSCMASPDPSCVKPNTTVFTNFTCMRDGYFPDPLNCSSYVNCQGGIAYQYTCTYPTPYYHPGLKYCVSDSRYCTYGTTSYYCKNYSQYRGLKIAVAYTNNYFIYCNDKGSVVAVDRCIGNYYFSTSAQTCLFACPNAGLFLKKDVNCANYYKCAPAPQGGYTLTNMTCPTGQAFSESDYSCVDRLLVSNCNLPYADLYSK